MPKRHFTACEVMQGPHDFTKISYYIHLASNFPFFGVKRNTLKPPLTTSKCVTAYREFEVVKAPQSLYFGNLQKVILEFLKS